MSSAPIIFHCVADVTAATAIICLGNRYVAGDDVGCRVYDHLAAGALPDGTELVDGGLCGLDMLRLIEKRHRVVFVDAVAGLADTGGIVVLSQEQVAAHAGRYGHGAGLPYLLRLLPQVCETPLPEITLVGAAGDAGPTLIQTLAARCLEVARHGS